MNSISSTATYRRGKLNVLGQDLNSRIKYLMGEHGMPKKL